MRRRRLRASQPLLLALLLLPAAAAEDAQLLAWRPGSVVRVATAPSLRPVPAALADATPTLAHGYAALITRHSRLIFRERAYPSTAASIDAVCRSEADLTVVVGITHPLQPPCPNLLASRRFRNGKTMLAGRTSEPLPHSLAALQSRRLAVVEGGPYADWLAVHHPDVQRLLVPDRHAALAAVASGAADATLGVESTLQPIIRRHFADDLQMQPLDTDFSSDLYLLVRSENAQLLARIEQALQDITLEEHADLLQLWAQQMLPTSVERALDWMRAPPPYWLVALAAALGGLPLLWHALRPRLGRGERSRMRAMGMISHEVRNSTQAILASIDLLGQSPLDAGQRTLLTAAHAAGNALRSLLGRMLDFSRLASGGFRPRVRACDVASLCQQALDAIRPHAQAKGLYLLFDCTPQPAPMVMLDPEALRQIIDNLLGNAVKFTDLGGVDLRLHLAPADDPQELLLDVIDSGIGISAKQAARLFQPFQQADGSQVRGGSGLGLAIARELASAMGGNLTLHSVHGRGTRFTLRLPVRISGSGVMPMPTGSAGTPLDGLDLLLVEDHPLTRRIIAEHLCQLGAQVHAVDDAAGALVEQARHARRAALIDIGLQDMDGYALAKGLREQSDLPLRLIALSAREGRGHVARCREAGFDAVLGKPLQATQLLQALGVATDEAPALIDSIVALDHGCLAEINRELLDIAQATDARDASALRHHAHRLQGALQICGATGQADIAADLWELGHDPAPDWNDAQRLLQALRSWHDSRLAEGMPSA
ncbi:ATP-binding protein [Stenotrophomonas maltophilia]